MNFPQNILCVATATTLLGLASVAPADAFTFGNSGILFDTDTTVNFEFLQSHGWWFGDFGVKDLSTGLETLLISETRNVDPGSGRLNDNLGTLGTTKAVLPEDAFTSFTFNQGKDYSFFLKSYDKTTQGTRGAHTRTVYSTSLLNPQLWNTPITLTNNNYDESLNERTVNGRDRVLFEGNLLSGLTLFFEDNGIGGNNDYDDFIVSARVVNVSVPEPTTVIGLGIVSAAMALSRRRKSSRGC
ncbi:PEP-CTERM sorting domain-containing protein [Laspinema olomoucense]|uniref:PEP-CTERM sorting domain-containing protein n=1 Tax=Laspinema olomoucense D3b TaxID=2953688 RepID=A0ABT2N728_9CYAN|nr:MULTISPECIES: PEP-CTERM sorting domain-containing protein [unclassified Laspinema]MCT7972256.1 PEP-CTERM sorting domain-containing protein [Laspinema sp. D3d]MCT7978392.1 PEP-CTERM sorting domain-containing protein [Laspinema sp. D3b]